MKPVVFIASVPENYDAIVSNLEPDFLVIHNSHSFLAKDPALRIQEMNKLAQLTYKRPGFDRVMAELEALPMHERLIRIDSSLMDLADVFVYDLDGNPGEWFIQSAFLKKIPSIAISKVLGQPVHPYFASVFDQILKPRLLRGWLESILVETRKKEADANRAAEPPSAQATLPSVAATETETPSA